MKNTLRLHRAYPWASGAIAYNASNERKLNYRTMENIINTLKLSEAVLKGVANFPELDTTQKHLIGHTLKMLNDSLEELSNSHKHSVVRPASALSDGGELLQGEGMAKGVRVDMSKVIVKPPLMIYEHKSNPEPQ